MIVCLLVIVFSSLKNNKISYIKKIYGPKEMEDEI